MILFIPFITYSMILFITLFVPLSAGYSSAAPAASIKVKVATTNRRMGIYWPYIRPRIEKNWENGTDVGIICHSLLLANKEAQIKHRIIKRSYILNYKP